MAKKRSTKADAGKPSKSVKSSVAVDSKLVPCFSKKTLSFLKEMAANNQRQWFNENKQRYEDCVRTPALNFITEMKPLLAKLSECLVVESKKVGGSLMRPYRDTRFGSDKTPLKTNVGMQFRHRVGKDVHAPGLYVHLEPGNLFIGAGVWRPDSATLKKIRAAIDLNPTVWRKTLEAKTLSAEWELAGESLSRPPQGFSADHDAIEYLKRKDHILIAQFSQDDLIADDFPVRLAKRFKATTDFMTQLCQAIGLPY